jgi:DNA-directed RNA polymerase subunit omega
MARITTRDCESVVPNRYELVLHAAELARELPSRLAREPGRMGEAKAVMAVRRIAERAADPDILRINLCRRRRDLPLLGESNDNQRPIAPAAGVAEAA